MSKVFISYRHSDTQAVTRRVYEWLTEELGAGRVFRDDECITPGEDFRHNLQEALDQCDVLLVMIGRRWLKSFDGPTRRLRDAEEDYVRFEIERALGRNLRVIPVRVDNAKLPREAELPPGLEQLAYRRAVDIRTGPDFDDDMQRLHELLRNPGRENFFFAPAPDAEEDSPHIRLFATIFPRLHFWMVSKGWLRQPPDLQIIHNYLDYLEGKLSELNQIVQYVPLGAAEAPGAPPRQSEYAPQLTRTEMLQSIRRTVRLLSGVFEGGDQATARLASVNSFSRIVRDVARLLRSEQRPFILLGDPGSGKSVTLRQVGLQITREGLRRAWPEVVIYVPLGSYHAARGDTPGEVWTLVMQRVPPEHSQLLDLLPTLAREGRLVILFDGMDEMERRLYGARVERLSEFASQNYRTVKTLFACRTNDFNPQFIHRQLVILGFDKEQVKEYLLHNFRPWPRLIDGQSFGAGQLAGHLLSTNELSETARNPFNLYLLGVFIQSRRALPKTRQELYDNFLQAVFARPRDAAGQPLTGLDPPAHFDAWARLAYRITVLHAGTSVALGQLGPEWSGGWEASVIKHALRCGLLVLDESDEQAIRFSHHRLQEYLTAKFLSSYGDERADVDWNSLIDTPRWQEILIDLASIQQERSEALHVVLESMRSVMTPSAGKSFDKRERAVARREWSVDEERTLADRVVLASQVIRELGQNATKLPPHFLETFTGSVARLAEKGRPTTQVKMLWAWGNTANFCPLSALDTPLRSEVDWVRGQAMSVIAGVSSARTHVDADLRRELVIDLTGGRLLRRLRAYRQAIVKANDPWLYVDLVWGAVCQVLYAAGLTGLLFASFLIAIALWPPPFDLERLLPGLSRNVLALMLLGISLSVAPLLRRARGRRFWHWATVACAASFALLHLLSESWRGEPFFFSLVGGVTRAGIALGAMTLGKHMVFWLSFGMYMLLYVWREDWERRGLTSLRIARQNSSFDEDRSFFKISGIALGALVGFRLLVAGYRLAAAYVLHPVAGRVDTLFDASPWPARVVYAVIGLLVSYWLRSLPRKALSGLARQWERLRSTGDGSWRAVGGAILSGTIRLLLALLTRLPNLLLGLLKAALWILVVIFGSLLVFSPLFVGMIVLEWAGIDDQKRSYVMPLLGVMVLLSFLALGLLKSLRPVWMALRSQIQIRLGRSAVFGMRIGEWARRVKGADPGEQAWLLSEASPQALGVGAGEFLRVLEGLEDVVVQEPAASSYWEKRHTLEEITRQDRLANTAELAASPPARQDENPSPTNGNGQPAETSDANALPEVEASRSPVARRFGLVRWVVSALLLLTATGSLLNLYLMRHRTVYVVNGLPTQVEVRIDDGEAFMMEPQTFRRYVIAEGSHTVVSRGARHEARAEEFVMDSSWFYERFLDDDIYVVNLEGAAIVRFTPDFIRTKEGLKPLDSFYFVGDVFVRALRPAHLFEEASGPGSYGWLNESELNISPDLPAYIFRELPAAYSDDEKIGLAEKHLGRDPDNTLLLAEYESFALRHGYARRCREFIQAGAERRLLPVEWYDAWQRLSLRLEGEEVIPRLRQRLENLLKGSPQGESVLRYLNARRQVSLAEELRLYEEMIRTEPTSAHAWLGKCSTLKRQGEFERAREACLESYRFYRESVERHFVSEVFSRIPLALRSRVEWDALLHETTFEILDLDLALGEYPTAAGRLVTLRHDWNMTYVAHPYALALDALTGMHDRARQRHEDYSKNIPEGRSLSAAYLHYFLEEFDEYSRAADNISDRAAAEELRAYARLELGDYEWAKQNYNPPYPEERAFVLLMSNLGASLRGEHTDSLWQTAVEELRASNLPAYRAAADLLESPLAPSPDRVNDLDLPSNQKAVLWLALVRRFPALREAALDSAGKHAYTPFPPGYFLRRAIKATEDELK